MTMTSTHPSIESALERAITSRDVRELQRAVESAAFLRETPGGARQKLRAATALMHRLERQQAAQTTTTTTPTTTSAAQVSPHGKETYDAAEFPQLASKYVDLKWRMIQMPGGAVKRPDAYYRLYGLSQQASKGDNDTERPMWAERGGIDFDGRAAWDAWTECKGVAVDKARLDFVKLYYEFSPSDLYSDTRGAKAASL